MTINTRRRRRERDRNETECDEYKQTDSVLIFSSRMLLTTCLCDFVHFDFLFLHRGLGLFFSVFIHACASRFFDHGQDFGRLHVEHFCDAALHDEEMGVVHIQLNTLKEILKAILRHCGTIDLEGILTT